ncbi:Integral membrane protein GPR155 [Gryllus bimaculatus]|nr:Integral membrane protein GPR155 [Gryllus bimaculatus]
MASIKSENVSVVTVQDSGEFDVENLYPALFQCFAIIICGYVAGRQNLISSTEAKGLNTFVGTFALPALIFMSLAELNLHSVNWMFLLAVLIAKSIIFGAVIIITLLVSRPIHPGRAGLFAIFCTQSNDFAIGYPIVLALYEKIHPEYAAYLYLMAPISLAILNPVGFILMEMGKQRDASITMMETNSRPRLQMIATIAKNIILNPVVLMTILGVIGNLAFSHEVPLLLAGLLKVLGSAFSATALFLLGHRMVGKVHTLQGRGLVVPGILIAVKLLALPLVTREVVSLLHSGSNESDTVDLSTYGFLYGTFPAAPGVFVFATQYSVDIDLIAAAMVACTFISAPFMFVSAKMVTVTKMKPSDYLQELDSFAFDISIIGIIGSLIGCVGIILWSKLDRSETWALYVQFTIYTVGVYSSRLWSALLAVVLLFLQCRSLCFVLKLLPYFIMVGWGVPIVAVTIMMCLQRGSIVEKLNPNFQYGETDTALTLFLLIFCFIVTVGCLVLHQRYQLRYARYMLLVDGGTSQDEATDVETDTETRNINKMVNGASSSDYCSSGCNHKAVRDIEELASPTTADGGDLCPTQFSCPSSIREQCHTRVDQYHIQSEASEEPEEDQQVLQHQVLLLLLACSMFVGIAFSIWTLVMDEMSGIYVELAFLDASLNFGQSLLVFAVFGLDTKAVILPLVRRWRKFWYKTSAVKLPDWEDLNFETRHVCDQFVLHHLENCRGDIAKDKRWRLQMYKKVFTGSALIDWLVQAGLARDRPEATQYASLLVNGRVLRHIERLYHFHDRPLLYTFEE